MLAQLELHLRSAAACHYNGLRSGLPSSLVASMPKPNAKKRRVTRVNSESVREHAAIAVARVNSESVRAHALTREQSAMLAAVLPNPKGWDPTKLTGKLRRRQRRILQRERSANFPERLLH